MSADVYKHVTVPPTDVQAALAWAEGASVAEVPMMGRHHVRVLAQEVRHLQLWHERLMDVIDEQQCPDYSQLDGSDGLLLWERMVLGVVWVVVLLAGAVLVWLVMAEEGGAL